MGLTVSGEKEAALRFRNMARRTQDLTPVWPSVGKYLSGIANQQFVTDGSRLGKPWRPLKPPYVAWKAEQGLSRRTLRATGALRRSFVSRPMDVERYLPQSAKFGSSLKTALWHQRGTHRNGRVVNPPRPILIVTPEIREQTKDILFRYISRGR